MKNWLDDAVVQSSFNTSPSQRVLILLFVLASGFLVQCQNQENPPPPRPAPQRAEQGPLEPQATPPSSQPQPPASINLTGTGSSNSTCCQIVANPDLKGRLGRLVVSFPDGANPGSTRIDIFKPVEKTALAGAYGGHIFDLLPGSYDVEISKKRLKGVTVQPAHDTRVKVGVLRVAAGGNTRIDVVESNGQPTLAGGFGNQTIGLPVGTFLVQVAGQAEPVTIEDNQVTEF